MNLGLVIGGIVLLVVVGHDVVRTVFDVGRGAGGIAGRVGATLWRGTLAARRRGLSHRLAESLGVASVLSLAVVWFVLLLTAWLLLFSAAPGAVVEADSGRPGALADRVYFAGGALFGLSYGDYEAGSAGWRMLVAAVPLTGFGLATLTVTYLVPVIRAATERRALARSIVALGATPGDIVVTAWDGARFPGLEAQLRDLIQPLATAGQLHHAFPALHYFHSSERDSALVIAVATLSEALTLLQHGVADDLRPSPALATSLRRTIDAFLRDVLLWEDLPERAPDPPRLDTLRQAGIPTIAEDEFSAAVADLALHRRRLVAIVAEDGWRWRDVEEPGD